MFGNFFVFTKVSEAKVPTPPEPQHQSSAQTLHFTGPVMPEKAPPVPCSHPDRRSSKAARFNLSNWRGVRHEGFGETNALLFLSSSNFCLFCRLFTKQVGQLGFALIAKRWPTASTWRTSEPFVFRALDPLGAFARANRAHFGSNARSKALTAKARDLFRRFNGRIVP